MTKATGCKDHIVASEVFSPKLSEEFSGRYHSIIDRIANALPINKIAILKEEINSLDGIEDSIEKNIYQVSLSVLVDLAQQGWIFEIKDEKLILRMEAENLDDKNIIRYRLSAERNAQFKNASVIAFIKQMETEKIFKNERISIRNLFGSPKKLLERINNHEQICSPYIQLVSNDKDEYSGYCLYDIWRYFRYTWAIPYKTMPGRNLFYLVRDSLQPYHPVIGIFALGNSVLNLTVRDDDIGWTVDSIKQNMSRKTDVSYCDQIISETEGKKIKVKISKATESVESFDKRTTEYADKVYPLLLKSISLAINDIYVADLNYHRQTRYPKQEQVDRLLKMAEEFSQRAINNKNNEKSPDWREESQTNLFKRKRASELAKLLSTRIVFNHAQGKNNKEKLLYLLSREEGRKAINKALIENRKRKIGSNMMDIIVCGSIPPYNDLLGGKLISMLACSPTVIRDYTNRYSNQVSEIASRMKGEEVIRDSRLVFLGTTSLYSVGSSQYNRIRVSLSSGSSIEFRKMGVTEGFGTVFFSKETTRLFAKILELQDGGKRINHVFGEGTSPRLRMISRGLSVIGVRSETFIKHYSPRIVYSINLAKNTNEYLLGLDDNVDYGFDINKNEEVSRITQEIIDFWYERWLLKRLTTVNIKERLSAFRLSDFLLGNI